MASSTIAAIGSATYGQPLDQADQADAISGFLRDGVALLPGALAQEALRPRALAEGFFADERLVESHGSGEFSLTRAFELDHAFRDLLVCEPIISLVEAILGRDCHMTSQNILRNRTGQAVDTWHCDDGVLFPLPDDVPRHPITPPPVLLHVFLLLSDVDGDDHGPTQIVPGSHRSGRPPSPDLVFDGQGPVSITGKAGDVYLHHHQTWHRGAPNRSERTRCVVGTGYGRRWVSQRLWPFGDYRLPAQVLTGADERLLRVLGRHPRGAYA
jgi:hypothetical protein